jgi:FkbM family methyltransferase
MGAHILRAERGESRKRLEQIFAEIHREGGEAASRRWRGHFDRIAAPGGKLVLFGTGQFGQWTLERLGRAGVEPCCFSDNNAARWGSRVQGIEVVAPAEAVARYGGSASFVVAIYNGSTVRRQLRELGCTHVLPAAALFWKYPLQFMPDLGIDAPERIVEQEAQIWECFLLLSDEASRHELCDQLEWRYWLRPEFLPLPQNAGELYFPDDLVSANEEEVFVDCGAFDGDSIRSFLRRGRRFRHLYALEPDAANRRALQNFLAQQPAVVRDGVTVLPYAVSDRDGTLSFSASGNVSSQVSAQGDGVTLECRKLHSLPWSHQPTYIKMDIEGSEPEALAGGGELLRNSMPVLAICLYHRTEHLWQIPVLIHSLAPEYALFLRRYAEDCWEQVCYAVPRHRRLPE